MAKLPHSYYVIYFSEGGKMRIVGRTFHTYEQARYYADTIESSREPIVVKSAAR